MKRSDRLITISGVAENRSLGMNAAGGPPQLYSHPKANTRYLVRLVDISTSETVLTRNGTNTIKTRGKIQLSPRIAKVRHSNGTYTIGPFDLDIGKNDASESVSYSA